MALILPQPLAGPPPEGPSLVAATNSSLYRTLDLGAWTDLETRIESGRGDGRAVALTPDTGSFWFFNPENLVLTVKVLDGRSVNGQYVEVDIPRAYLPAAVIRLHSPSRCWRRSPA